MMKHWGRENEGEIERNFVRRKLRRKWGTKHSEYHRGNGQEILKKENSRENINQRK